jgi:hypothetical protein
MKLLVEIKDEKAAFFYELMHNLKFIKVKPLTSTDAEILEELQEAVENMKLVSQGRLRGRPVEDLLNEL